MQVSAKQEGLSLDWRGTKSGPRTSGNSGVMFSSLLPGCHQRTSESGLVLDPYLFSVRHPNFRDMNRWHIILRGMTGEPDHVAGLKRSGRPAFA
jgi:hypothetical protein